MKCDRCDRPATVHEVTIIDGLKADLHLCEECARGAGMPVVAAKPVQTVLSGHFIISTKPAARSGPRVCAGCGLAFADFRQAGVLGCPECYEAFEAQLEGLILRTHAGASGHVGKHPGGTDEALDRQVTRQLRIRRLLQDLDHAVGAEQFERAARLRDELRSLEAESRSTTSDA